MDDLFSRHGVRAVGVDRIVAESGVAKMSLYRHFASKDDLVLHFLQEREQRWTNEWLSPKTSKIASMRSAGVVPRRSASARINVLLEFDDREHRVRLATVEHLRNIRSFVRELAAEAGAADPEALAHEWHILMKGSIVAAGEGDRLAAQRARAIGGLLLEREAIAV